MERKKKQTYFTSRLFQASAIYILISSRLERCFGTSYCSTNLPILLTRERKKEERERESHGSRSGVTKENSTDVVGSNE